MKKLRSARLWYAVSLFISLMAASLLGGEVAYHMVAALIALAGAAALAALLSKRRIAVRHALDGDVCVRGGEARYALQIRNKGLFPLTWAEVRLSSTRGVTGNGASFETALAPYGSANHIAKFSPPHRGLYVMLVESVRVSDPFRLTKLSARKPHPLTLKVMPKLLPISEVWKRRLDPQGQGGLFTQSSDEPAVDSRTYRYGDSPRRIHWNLTARRRELMVRQYESLENRRLLVVLDLSPFEADDVKSCEDALIESCLSVVRYALERRIETTLVYAEGSRIRGCTGRDMRMFGELHHAMSVVEFASAVPPEGLLNGAERAQMLYLFCARPPSGDLLAAFPQDIPIELALVRTFGGVRRTPVESAGLVRVTELMP
ncbi:MAG: DUF58 domain-containing protein [Oscillospiraceae bacterium]|nr:DUF58 domain-containing protein [Oscillospiraceae bacterium]